MTDVFRKKSLDRIKNPEELDDYIKVSRPGVWMVLAVIVLLVVGLLVWAVFGTIEDGDTVYHPLALLFGLES